MSRFLNHIGSFFPKLQKDFKIYDGEVFSEVYDGDFSYSKAEYDTDARVEDFFYHIVLEIRMIVKSFKYYLSFLF